MNHHVLIVDDDLILAKTLQRILHNGSYNTSIAHTAEDGLQQALSVNPHLILLDVMIPAMGGWELCRQIREHSDVPIIFLTAMGHKANIIHGLELGADDYVVKPFEPEIILARIKANLRRTLADDKNEQNNLLSFENGNFTIDKTERSIVYDGQRIELTRREFDLLYMLADNAGRVMTADTLVQRAWGMEHGAPSDNIKPYIHYLRKKIEKDPTSPQWLQTVRGIGYRFNDA